MNSLKKSIMGKYNAADVDMLLQKVREDYELCLKNQKERIFGLREENRELLVALERYRNNERYISGALTRAEETAQALILRAKAQAQQQLEQARAQQLLLNNAAEGCYRRLCKLRGASESICKDVARVIGEYDEPEKNNVRPFISLHDSHV